MSDYTNVTRVKADMPDSGIATDSDYDDVIAEMITIASRLIDREIGVWDNFFYPSTTASTRYFDGSGELEQYIDPLVSLTSVSVSETGGRSSSNYTSWTLNTDYYTQPYNTTDNDQPISMLVVDNFAGSKGSFAPVRKGVKVVGVFGWSTSPPKEIAQACKIQTIRWVMKAKQSYQDASANAQTGELIYAKNIDPDIKRLLSPYKIARMV